MNRPADFRSILRRGRRAGGATLAIHLLRRDDDGPSRFGFVVSKAVGGSVTRNLVRRRLRAASVHILDDMGCGVDVVVRALPASGAASWVTLQAEITEGVRMELARS